MADIETLTELERELLLTDLGLGMSHLDDGTVVSNGDIVEKVLRILDAQAKRIEELKASRRVWVAFVGEFADRRTLGVFASKEAAEAASRRYHDDLARHWEGLNPQGLAAGARRETPDVEELEMSGEGDLSSWEARLAKARQRISELEAQVLSADTVSKAEYQAMVQQRDTLRQERNTASEELKEVRRVAADNIGLSGDPGTIWFLDGEAEYTLEQIKECNRLAHAFWAARRAALGKPKDGPEWQAFVAARADLWRFLEEEE